MGIHFFFFKIARKILVIKLSGFAETFTFSTPAPVVSVLADMAHYAMSSSIWHNVRTCMTWRHIVQKRSVTLKIVYNKKKIQIFIMNMPFISSHEVRESIFHSWLCHSWNVHFLLHWWNKWHIHSKNLNILYIFFAIYLERITAIYALSRF